MTQYERRALLAAGIPAALVDDPGYVPVGGHLHDADRFDNAVFRVSPREAELMDPQHRLMLESAWSALEDAGRAPLAQARRTAVFASMTGSGYLRSIMSHGQLDPATLDDVVHGTEPDFMASRIAYKLSLTGPALAVQTACSSSLVAVHLAVQALLSGDCDEAAVVAAGIRYPQAGYMHLPGGVLSASGHCRPFDERADGVVGGSGVACVILRRLADLEPDDPEPYGIILGTAVNNDGSAKAGYYAPSARGQEAVIQAAFAAADIDAASVGYIEAHATGTQVGDPIEWSAASAALARMGARAGQVAVGAVKANIGHLDAASGLAGLIKALAVVREGLVPPVAGFTRPNPLMEVDGSPLYIPATGGRWSGPTPRRAGVSSFGIGGTNAHVVIEQASKRSAASRGGARRGRILLLSAADHGALSRAAARLADHMASAEPDPDDVSFTLAIGRAALPERLAVCGQTSAELASRLATGTHLVRGCQPAGGAASAVFLFPGQGSQYPGMACPYECSLPGFSAALDECLTAFGPSLAEPLRRVLLRAASNDGDADRDAHQDVDQTELAQPAIFAVGYAAATALAGLGLVPAVLAGHSLGEITAACFGGVIDLKDATRLVVARGRAMQACQAGAMLALGCAEQQAMALMAEGGPGVELAVLNGPDSCVVGGPADAVAAFQAWLGDRVYSKRLRTSRAFHTSLIEAAVPRLAAELATIGLRATKLPLAACATGQIIPVGAHTTRDAFAEQARRVVRFGDAMAAIAARHPGGVVVEIGPGRAHSATTEALGLTAIALSPARGERPDEEVLSALGALWTMGQPIAVGALCGAGRRIRLPTYPFAGPSFVAREAVAHAQVIPAPSAGADAHPAVVLAGDVPEFMARTWAELLGHDHLDGEADFFELGGDSLLITRLARRVNTEFGIKVPIRLMLAGRTLGRQTAIVLDLVRSSHDERP